MMPRLRWRRILAALVITLGSLSLTGYALLATTDGSRWLLRQAESFAPIKVNGLQGNLIAGLQIRQLEMTLPSVNAQLNNSEINLDLWPLVFAQELRIASLHIEQALLRTHAQEKKETDPTLPGLPALPVHISLQDFHVQSLEIDQQAAISIRLQSVSLAKQVLQWKALTLQREAIHIASSGKWKVDSLHPSLTTKTQWSMSDISGELIGEGPLQQWKFNHHFTLNSAAVKGQVFSRGSITLQSLNTMKLTSHHQIGTMMGEGWQVLPSEISLATDLTTFEAEGTLSFSTPQLGVIEGKLQANGKLNNGANLGYTFQAIKGEGKLDSHIQWQSGLSIAGHLAGKQLHLHSLHNWPLNNQAITRLETDFHANQTQQWQWQLNNTTLEGLLGDAPFTLKTQITGDQQTATVDTLQVTHLGNHLIAQASLTPYDISADIEATFNDLSPYQKGLQGDAKVSASMAFSPQDLQRSSHIRVNMASRQLNFKQDNIDLQLGGVELQVNSQQNTLTGQLQSHFIHSQDIALENFSQQLEGHINSNDIALNTQGNTTVIVQGHRLPMPVMSSQWQWFKTGPSLLTAQIRASDNRLSMAAEATIDRQQTLDANAHLILTDWQWLTRLTPRVDQLAGKAELFATAHGPINQTDGIEVHSHFTLTAPEIALIDPAIKLNDTLLQGELKADGSYTLSGEATQGSQPIALNGRGLLLGDSAPTLTLDIAADKLRATTPKVEVTVSPALSLNLDSEKVQLRGTIAIPSAEIEVSELPDPSFKRSEDVHVVGRLNENQPQTDGTLAQDFLIKLRLDDNVLIKAAGLATKLRGELTYKSVTGQLPQLQGKLDLVDGSLSSQSGDLAIKRGSLLFSGNADNPTVDIIAVRQIDSPALEVGLHITGTVQNLQTAIISIPAIDQTRALSYLVFGYDMMQDEQGNGNSNAQLMSAAMSLGISQTSGLMKDLKRSTGLDELTAIANDSGSASLIAGKHINSKLYARYRYDMAEALSVLLLRYRLSQRWTLEAESGADNSIDILYRLGE